MLHSKAVRLLSPLLFAAVVVVGFCVPAQATTSSTFSAAASPAATVVKGQALELKGRLGPGSNRKYRLQVLMFDEWRTATTGSTDGNGRVSFRMDTTKVGTVAYRFQGLATSKYSAVTSRTVRIDVRAPVTGKLSATQVARTEPATVTGTTFPVASGRLVLLQHDKAGVWQTAIRAHTTSTGSYSFALPTSTVGSTSYRVALPAVTGKPGGQTSSLQLVVTRSLVGPYVVTEERVGLVKQEVVGGLKAVLHKYGPSQGSTDVTPGGDLVSVESKSGSDGSTTDQIYLSGPTTAKRLVATSARNRCYRDLEWDALGRYVLVAESPWVDEYCEEVATLRVLDTATRTFTSVAIPAVDEHQYVLGAAGQIADLDTDASTITLIDTLSGARHPVATPAFGRVMSMSAAPGGRLVIESGVTYEAQYHLASQSHPAAAPALITKTRMSTDCGSNYCNNNGVQVSPDGLRVAWIDTTSTDKGLFVASLDGSDKKQITSINSEFGGFHNTDSVHWVGSAHLVYGQSGSGTAQGISANGGAATWAGTNDVVGWLR